MQFINSLGNRNLTIKRQGVLIEELTETLDFNDNIFAIELINGDLAEVRVSIDLDALEEAQFTRTDIDGNYTLLASDHYIAVDTSSRVDITIGPAAYNGKKIFIKDETGNANARPITLITSGGALIDNQDKVVLKLNYIGIQLIYSNNMWRII